MVKLHYTKTVNLLRNTAISAFIISFICFRLELDDRSISSEKLINPAKKEIPIEFRDNLPKDRENNLFDLIFIQEPDFLLKEFTYINTNQYYNPNSGRYWYPASLPVGVTRMLVNENNFTGQQKYQLVLSGPSFNLVDGYDKRTVETAVFELKCENIVPDHGYFMHQWVIDIAWKRFWSLVGKYLYVLDRSGCKLKGDDCIIRAIKINLN